MPKQGETGRRRMNECKDRHLAWAAPPTQKPQAKKQCADKSLEEIKISFNLAVICKSENHRRTYTPRRRGSERLDRSR
jgi:hypothetical protein